MYVPEEIVENFNLIKAIFEGTDTSNRWQLVTDLQGLGGYHQLQTGKSRSSTHKVFYFVLPCRNGLEDGQAPGGW
jgi:hypothetical protein